MAVVVRGPLGIREPQPPRPRHSSSGAAHKPVELVNHYRCQGPHPQSRHHLHCHHEQLEPNTHRWSVAAVLVVVVLMLMMEVGGGGIVSWEIALPAALLPRRLPYPPALVTMERAVQKDTMAMGMVPLPGSVFGAPPPMGGAGQRYFDAMVEVV